MGSALKNQAQLFEKEMEKQKEIFNKALAIQSIKCEAKQKLKGKVEESITEKHTKQKFIEYQLKCDDMQSQLKKLTKRLTNDIHEKMIEQKEKEIENGDGDKLAIEQEEGPGVESCVDINVWLGKQLKLPQYLEAFMDEGWDDLDLIKDGLEQGHLKQMKVKTGHQFKIMNAIKYLKKQSDNQ